ncbi:DNA-3-methyladenine glycosylase [Flammeovirga sp. EKP202]|uniref:DNA-3-methyladenine glycosylase family protein n=1 Tax=Flammeovirga sp. EKP202 TaxID=2770592 RepID=UPI00165ED4D6|nr:DNA-3-methyladenine glycosylase 2 family protein [Flammeovirga sp. EKP202]MBD0402263.1 DNA-3-methyladenine glycosylase 2 family protein [Flammeovirga sp. EKP202]
MSKYFQYSEIEIEFLKKKDKKLKAAIERIGMIQRSVNPDLFSSIIKIIIGQQISTRAQETIWERLKDKIGDVTAENIEKLSDESLQSIGISFRKASYIKNFTSKVITNEFDIECLQQQSDESVIEALSSLKGIGEWTAEMLMIFSMQRKDILSYGDLAIIRGIRMLYRHREVSKERFLKYKKRFSPYGSVASLYLWAIAGGAIEELNDPISK